MKKDDIRILGGAALLYLFITALSLYSPVALMSLAIAIFIVAIGLELYCKNKTCKFY